MSFSYCVYGLGLRLNRPIAALEGLSPPSRVDVELVLGSMPEALEYPSPADSTPWYCSEDANEDGIFDLQVSRLFGGKYFRSEYGDGTIIVVDARGSQVWATWPDSATIEDTATYLLGPTLGLVLRLRGVTCLHASAVAIEGRAIAVAGPSGAGKSTCAAAFARMGYSILSDDIVVLSEHSGGFLVQPAYPRVRLWPESVAGLFGAPDALPRLTPSWSKRFLDLSSTNYRFQSRALPLAAIYLLGERSDSPTAPLVESISARSALMGLVADTYATRLLDAPQRAEEFEVLGRLVGSLPMRRVKSGSDFSQLSEQCRAMLNDFDSLDLHFVQTT